MRNDLFSRVLRLPVPFLMEKETGYLLSRIGETNRIGFLFSSSMARILVSIFEFAGILAILLYMNRSLTLFCLIPLPLLFLSMKRWSKGITQRSKEAMEAGAGLTGKMDESLSGILEIKALSGERKEEEDVKEKMSTYLKKSISQSLHMLSGQEMMQLLGMAGGIIVLLVGGFEIITGRFTLGGYVAFSAYVGRLYAPATLLATTGLTVQPALVALKRVKEIFDLTEEAGGKISLEKIKGNIEFNNVHFSYGEKEVLKGISLKIKTGEKVAIVGPNGSGKSTMMRLLLGFFKPASGIIKIDGHDLTSIKISSLREKFGIVSQNIFLFNDTVEKNIKYCKPDATEEEVKKAMDLSGTSSFLDSLPLKEKTPIGSRGLNSQVGRSR
jgi:ABC-type bacteriocin/lantibiotic exporter with double-glycine peptidase domain